mgnify:FL=1
MTTIETTTASIFLTDYASYNNGTQFEFGHWVDLTKFTNVTELNKYITDHFKEADKTSPLDEYGTTREEVMITDYEGFPSSMYSESNMDYASIFKYIQLDYDNLEDYEKIQLWNDYIVDEKTGDSFIYHFDDHFYDEHFEGQPLEAAKATRFGNVSFNHEYIYFNGYGNLETTEYPVDMIEEDKLIKYLNR